MIKFENTEVMNFKGAFRGVRNPLNSWDKSDSRIEKDFEYQLELGPNDLRLAQNLIKAGPDHRKFMRQILVSVDITAPLYWWKEFDTYKVGTVANSCSTMHKIHAKEFTFDDFSHEHLYDGAYYDEPFNGYELLYHTINTLNYYRNEFIKTKDKKYWWQLIQLLPSSYNQKRTVTLNYETLRNIYNSRRNHKLDEWSIGFMEWINTLPYSEELIKHGL